MPTIDELIELFDPRDAYQFTQLIERKRAESADYNVPFCPMRAFDGREVELNVVLGYGAGLAPFKADNASTPIAPMHGDVQRQFIELVLISEKDVLKATDLIDLESRDPRVRLRAGRDLIAKTVNLRIRNTNRCKWMAWYTAVYGQLPITYPDGASLTVDWDFAGANMNAKVISATHLPVAAVAWNHTDGSGDYDADVITDLQTWTQLLSDDAGIDPAQSIAHMSTTTFNVLKKNAGIKGELSTFSPRIITPKLTEVAEILGVAEIRLVNDFYWDTDNRFTKTKYLPDGKLLLTTPYSLNGRNIAEMYDGLVARVVGEDIAVSTNPGMIADIYVNKEAVVKNTRVSTARMVILNHPEAFLTASVW